MNLWSDKAYKNEAVNGWTYEVHFINNLVYVQHFETDAPDNMAYQETLNSGRYNFGMKLYQTLR